ncbi:MAG: S8 family serine peptidase [bacterium]|nr:S8 family serine peptidase [bacterium]
MKLRLPCAGLLLLFVGCFSHLSSANEDDDELNVWLTFEEKTLIPELVDEQWTSKDEGLAQIFQQFQINFCEPALPSSRKEALQKVYEIRGVGNIEQFSESLAEIGHCHSVEHAPQYELLNTNAFPDDYNLTFSNDYALDLIDAEKAWEYSTGDPNTVIGITDGAFFPTHEELVGATVLLENPISAPTNFYYHGTAVAVAVAGNTNNGIGKSAIGYDCSLALLPMGYNEMLQLCYEGVRIINVSWSSGCMYNPYYELVLQELFDNDCIVVAAAGNGNTCGGPNGVVYPASLDGVISVTSVGPYDNHEMVIGNPNTTHQHNEYVDICAPGYQIAGSPIPGYYTTGSGTSFATPYVTGTIGLMLSLRPCLSREEVIDILSITAADVYASNPSDYYGQLGAGRLDAGAALEYLAGYNCVDAPMVVDTTVGLISINNPKPTGTSGSNLTPNASHANQTANTSSLSTSYEVKLFPNPNKGTFQVTWAGLNLNEVRVTDAAGQLVAVQDLPSSVSFTEISLHHSGVYFLQLLQEGRVVANEKVIVQ